MTGTKTKIVVGGNKFDLVKTMDDLNKNKPIVDAYLKENNAKHLYTSAKSGENVNEIFESVMNLIISDPELNKKKKSGGLVISDENETKPKKGGCCGGNKE